MSEYRIAPEDFKLARASAADIRGGTAAENATTMRAILSGQTGPLRDMVLLNAGAALVAADRAPDISTGINHAQEAIDGGGARGTLDRLIALTQSFAEIRAAE
jgi:anthranilate phosphoribosyltransferase